MNNLEKWICLSLCALLPVGSSADLLTIQANDFDLTPTYNDVTTFEFSVDIAVPITPGTSYSNPDLNSVDYSVYGTLDGTPSGFPAFNLVRAIEGAEFYNQGSSMTFEVDVNADLSDGIQVSELVGADMVFELNGREVGTGRYHPAIVQLNANGTGTIRNSNNTGGINPVTQMEVNVDFGEEYITELSFSPSNLTLFTRANLILMDGFEDP